MHASGKSDPANVLQTSFACVSTHKAEVPKVTIQVFNEY